METVTKENEMTITLGWWVIPAIITLIGFFVASYAARDDTGSGYGAGIASLFLFSAWLIASMLVWIIYLALKLAFA